VQALRIGSGDAEGLLRHIVNGTVTGGRTTDNGAWLTGNGWALAGMVKVIAIISQSEYASEMQDQISNLIGWSQDILDGCYKYADPLIRNYVNDSCEGLFPTELVPVEQH
jgi:rhamnogalacturonyl hydrolase YesR